ncbi:hypothetical protein WAF17_21950 [Bernardetia sp. ABR2-2B]|uniref:hypothetical protein n=1 Tax=Bernardetia sp. ABR2-2B TaxID=3127472 RepID=UPI0030CA969A
MAQFTKISKEEIEKMKADGINILDSAGKIYLRPKPNYVPPKKPKPQKITDTKDDNNKQKEACECLKLIYTVSFNGYFLGCF